MGEGIVISNTPFFGKSVTGAERSIGTPDLWDATLVGGEGKMMGGKEEKGGDIYSHPLRQKPSWRQECPL